MKTILKILIFIIDPAGYARQEMTKEEITKAEIKL